MEEDTIVFQRYNIIILVLTWLDYVLCEILYVLIVVSTVHDLKIALLANADLLNLKDCIVAVSKEVIIL